MKTKNIEDIYELTSIQQGFLFHSLYAPEAGNYVEHISFTFKGKLDVKSFCRAWETLIKRHSILRTAIHMQEIDKPLQVVHRHVELPLEELDWSNLPANEQEQRYAAFLKEDRRRGFDFTKPPLMRLTLIKLDANTYKFAWRFPHAIMDGWSFSVALQEIIFLYKAYWHRREPDLLSVRPYRDYVAWWKRQDASKAEEFWREQFRGFVLPELLQLGGVDNLSDGITHHWEELQLDDIAERLRLVGQQGQLTQNTLFQAAWTIVLSRYMAEDNIVVGSSVAHRPPEMIDATRESMIGPLLVTLPVRAQLQPNEPLLLWLQQFQRQMAAIREHANASLVQIHEWSGLPQCSPLFESTVVFENVPIPEGTLQNEGLEVLDVVLDGRPHYPLTLAILSGPTARLVYERRRFSRSAVIRLLGNLKTVLTGIADNPHQRLGELNLLTSEERHQLLEGWNLVELQSVDCCLHESFEKQAVRTPNSIAVVFENQSLTYRELDERSNQLAHRLRKLGIDVENRVGLFVERSLNMVIGLLGILKAGAAPVPLDPSYPNERLAFMCEDSGAAIVLTELAMLKKLPQLNGKMICFDDGYDIACESIEKVNSGTSPDNVAYVLYTSGSTGHPKGTLVTHANVARLITSTKKWFDFSEKDVWALFHSYAFDFSVWEMWGAFLNGSRLIIVPHWVSLSPEVFYEFLHRHQVTVLNQTPSAFQPLIIVERDAPVSKELALRYIIFGGEKLDIPSLKPWIERHGDEQPRLINMYGITETTVHVTYRRITAKDLSLEARSVIGRSLPDLNIYLVDQHLQLVPIGAKGEICVAGDGVTRGYLNRPELTEQRFVPHPFSNKPGARMYRSGDLARYREDGELEFLGRADNQVKIRGLRIELGEIEACLRSHEGIRSAVVVVGEDVPGEQQLVAYFVPEGTSVSISELRDLLRQQLPDYMIPVAFMQLDKIPLTLNGKLDRRALPSPTDILRDEESVYIAPRTPIEECLVEILEEFLTVPNIGVQDNLLSLGLHSLLATRILIRIRKVLKVNLPLRVLFEMPTVEALARLVDTGGGEGGAPNSAPVDLKAEVSLDSSIQPASNWEWNPEPERIFLTGATGFLGGFLLEELLRINSAKIFCLVRGQGIEEGKRKLRDNLIACGIWNESFDTRIVPVLGDLSTPLFGMGSETFTTLAEQVDEIYHCGALVNFLYPYTQLKSSNVLGTQEVLRLATTGKVKPLHYISTLGTVGVGQEEPVMEMDLPEEPPNILLSGYAQSKWVAERIVTLARSRGLPISIYRPGRVTGHSKTGVWTTDNAVCQAIKACFYLQKVPDLDFSFEMVPVDYVSSAIVLLAREQNSLGKVFHVTNPQTVSVRDFTAGLTPSGYDISWVSFEEWNNALRRLAGEKPDQDFATTHSLFSNLVEQQMSGQRDPDYDCSNTLALLGNRLSCPSIDNKLLQNYFSYLIRVGYITVGKREIPTEKSVA